MFEKKIKLAVAAEVEKIKEGIEKKVEKLCFEAIKAMFEDKRDKEYKPYMYSTLSFNTIGGEFKERAMESIQSVINEDVSNKCRYEAGELIKGEEFIDGIVKRIKTKQLK